MNECMSLFLDSQFYSIVYFIPAATILFHCIMSQEAGIKRIIQVFSFLKMLLLILGSFPFPYEFTTYTLDLSGNLLDEQ